MSLKLIKRPAPKAIRKVSNIDAANGFLVSGWVYDSNRPDYQPLIEVVAGDLVLGEGRADRYRADLQENGFGDGYHAFSIKLIAGACDGQERQVYLRDKLSGQNLGANDYVIGGHKSADVIIEKVDSSGIAGRVIPKQSPVTEEDVVCVYIDGNLSCSASCIQSADQSDLRFHIALPVDVFDGLPHVFHADIAGKSVYSVPHYDILPAIQTQWDLLQTSSRRSGYAALSKVASYRYESLRTSLSQIGSPEQLENLNLAHEIVVAGHMPRKQYPTLTLPTVENPEVTIVIPVHNKFELTYLCLASCILAPNNTSWEVIVVDDASSDTTCQVEDIAPGVRVVRNRENRGFVQSCNEGASVARGQYLLFLNNDTEVTAGWIDELVQVFHRYPNVGAAGSKLIYPDGKLQDAGGIVWNNGLPWNVGHGQNADDPSYNYCREVDYLTGASLMVERTAWANVGGFTESYAPAYYEDTDLAFKLRAKNYKTIYSPFSTVIHYEGQSNGTDLSSGIKKYQQINAARFEKNWSHAFEGLGVEGQDLHINKDRNRHGRILMIDHAFPCEGQDAGSYAAIQEIKLLIDLGCKVTFVPHNFTHLGKYTDELQRMGVECIYAPFYTSVNVFLDRRGDEFDAVYITRYDVAERVIPDVREYTNARIIFNNADLHFLREMRSALANGETDLSGPRNTRDRELAVMNKVDVLLSYNEIEHTIISTHTMRADNLFTCPWVLTKRESDIGFDDRSDLAFLGGYGHPPNREAVEYFVREVMPLVRESGQKIKLRLYGSNFPEELHYLESEDVIVEGYVEKLETVFDTCRVFVAPLISGAGIKGKVLDSIAYGVPTVLSPVAAESTGLIAGQSMLMANSPEEWASAITRLHSDQSLWENVRDRAFDVVERQYSKEHGLQLMSDMLRFASIPHSGYEEGSGDEMERAASA